MTIRPVLAAVATVVVGALTGSAIAHGGLQRDHLADGTYLAYVRTEDPQRGTVAVHLVDEEDADEALLNAGLLITLDLIDDTARPFRIVVRDDTIIELQTADDVPPDRPSSRD
jgi:hypothetical protein